MTELALVNGQIDCWRGIGVWGDQSCPELQKVVHCRNCPVFKEAGKRFLATQAPPGYLEEWAARLSEPEEDQTCDRRSALVFRLGDEWLALSVAALREVVPQAAIHRIPFQKGLLAGVVNVRGELHLAARLDRLLGIASVENTLRPNSSGAKRPIARLLVGGTVSESWVFPVDEVDRVHRFAVEELECVPPTLGRAKTRFTRGIFHRCQRSIGLLDEGRLFEALRTNLK